MANKPTKPPESQTETPEKKPETPAKGGTPAAVTNPSPVPMRRLSDGRMVPDTRLQPGALDSLHDQSLAASKEQPGAGQETSTAPQGEATEQSPATGAEQGAPQTQN